MKNVVAQAQSAGTDAVYVVCDVADRAMVASVAETAIARFGRIDSWINVAGVGVYARLDEIEEKDARRLFETNFWGVVYGCTIRCRTSKRSGGALITVGSEESEDVVPLQGMYATTKHAVKGYVDALRVEVENVDKAQVSITLIQPTAVNTPFPQHARNYMAEEPKLPSPMIDPQQVADAIIDAACHHQRDVKVGAMAVVNTLASTLVPRLADKLSAKYVDKQQYDEAPRNPAGILHAPGEAGQIYGSGPREPEQHA